MQRPAKETNRQMQMLISSQADFTSEVQVEEETSIADGLYLGDIPADNSIGQIIDGNVVFNGVSEETSLFVPVYGEKGGSKIAVRDMTWESTFQITSCPSDAVPSSPVPSISL